MAGMNFLIKVNLIISDNQGGNFVADNTHEFVEKVHEKQAKAKKYSKRKGNSHESNKLPGKQPNQDN